MSTWPRNGSLSVAIPGSPHAQQRARSVARYSKERGKYVGDTFEASGSRDWKSGARVLLNATRVQAGLPLLEGGPVELFIIALFPRPKRLGPGPRVWCDRHVGDFDNIAKAVSDACNGTVWRDDALVARGIVERWYVGTGENPCTLVRVIAMHAAQRSFWYGGA